VTNKSKSQARLYCGPVYLPDKRAVEIELHKARYTENREAGIRTQIRYLLSTHHASIIIPGTHKADGNSDCMLDVSSGQRDESFDYSMFHSLREMVR